MKNHNFLANKINKQRFINMLATRLFENSCTVKIVPTAVEYAKSKKVTVILEDTELLVDCVIILIWNHVPSIFVLEQTVYKENEDLEHSENEARYWGTDVFFATF